MKYATMSLLLATAQAGNRKGDLESPCRTSTYLSKPMPGYVREPLQDVEDLPENWLWNSVDGVNEVTDETCSIYRARGHDNGQECSPMTVCENCMPGAPCFVPDEYKVYGVDEFGKVSGEQKMMQEIYQRGPIACGIAVPDALENYTSGIFEDKTGDVNIVHDISIVGYGVENGTKYWTVRNSWGTHFGESGFVRVIRGTNNIAIESDCAWSTPKDTWTDGVRHNTTEAEKNDPRNVATNSEVVPKTDAFMSKGGCRVAEAFFEEGERPPMVQSWEELQGA